MHIAPHKSSCHSNDDNAFTSIALASACIGMVCVLANVFIIAIFVRDRKSFRRDFSVKSTVYQVLMDFCAGMCMVVFSFGVTDAAVFFWNFSTMSLWNFSIIICRLYYTNCKPDVSDKYKNADVNSKIYALCLPCLLFMSMTINSLELEDKSIVYCQTTFGSVVGDVGSAISNALCVFVGPFLVAILMFVPYGKQISKENSNSLMSITKMTPEVTAMVYIYVFLILLATSLRWLFILFKPLTMQSSVSYDVIVGISVITAGVRCAANPLFLWEMREFCSADE